jgi:hypothetical protein
MTTTKASTKPKATARAAFDKATDLTQAHYAVNDTSKGLFQGATAAALRDVAIANQRELRQSLVVELAEALATMIPETAANAIVDGTLHPAVQIDWSLVLPSDDFCPF